MADEPKRVSMKQARQGVTGHNVRYVLAISLGTAAIALILIVIAFVT